MQAYQGYGYSEAFNKNMQSVLQDLEQTQIDLRCEVDVLCSHCPYCEAQQCQTQEKVMKMDQLVLETFHLKEQTYFYLEAIAHINAQLDEATFDLICGNCSWYDYGICKMKLLSK